MSQSTVHWLIHLTCTCVLGLLLADAVVAVAWNPVQRDVVATGGCDDKAYIWRVGQDAYESTSGSMATCELIGHTDTVQTLAFNAAGTLLATGGMDGETTICSMMDLSEGDTCAEYRLHDRRGTYLCKDKELASCCRV